MNWLVKCAAHENTIRNLRPLGFLVVCETPNALDLVGFGPVMGVAVPFLVRGGEWPLLPVFSRAATPAK
jgi:hypothetical protein